MSTVNQQIKKNVKAATSKKPQVKKNTKTSITSESPQIKKDASTNGNPKVTQGQKLLQAMTAQKAAKQALLKGVKNTHVSFDEEGNEDKVETVVQKKEDNKGEKRKNEEQIEENKEKPKKKIKKNKVKIEETRRENKQEEALEYVRSFVNDKQNWKFKKVQQIWILQNLYKIPENDFDNVLKYLKDLQGSSREKTRMEANDKIPKEVISNSLTGYANVGYDNDDDDFDAEKLLSQAPVKQVKQQEESNEIKRARLILDVLS
ncbi:hypothetical protein G6F37_011377 [Rhizopus arrhizus]|nr:hypothetical protein G6F38_011453 [Rhizopus arrhizus]KAG1149646.1 hypothetical protein G6F37_011377 [Rhizopus arrhizus]